MNNKGQSFIGGAFTLMISAAIVKVIGALFKIPLAAVLGGEGMGYYMTAYSMFNPVFALSVAGFSVSVSKLCSMTAAKGKTSERDMIFDTALMLFPSIGLLLSVIIFFAAPHFVNAVDNPAALRAVRTMAPSLFFCCITAVFRGRFEGNRNMMPTAVSQVTESVVKLFCGLYLSYRCIEKASAEYVSYGTVFGIAAEDTQAAMSIAAPYAASAAIAGVAVSTGVGCLVMMTFFLFSEKTNSIYRKAEITVFEAAFLLIKMAVPVCAGALVINMMLPLPLTHSA